MPRTDKEIVAGLGNIIDIASKAEAKAVKAYDATSDALDAIDGAQAQMIWAMNEISNVIVTAQRLVREIENGN